MSASTVPELPSLVMDLPALRVLLIEDSEFDAQLLLAHLRRGEREVYHERVETGPQFREALQQGTWDIIIADYNLPQFSGPEALHILQQLEIDLPFIIVSGGIGEETAVAAMKAGAHDYLMKGHLARLLPAVEREIREAANRDAKRQAKEALRKNQEQFRIAREIQQHLFPTNPPHLDCFEIAGASRPAEATGGDYFDYLPMLRGCVGIVVGDVTGHGVGPALLMAETRAYLRILARDRKDPADILIQANEVLAGDIGGERFVSLLLACLDPRGHSLNYVNAGHPPAYVLDSMGKAKTAMLRSGPPLGLRPETTYMTSANVPLEKDDIIVLLTDGFEEAVNREEQAFGVERALETVHDNRNSPAQVIVEKLYAKLTAFTHGEPQADDLTVVIVKVTA
jgi:sigma-B regulation protein RsbU (phosphoserine phosphatase)